MAKKFEFDDENESNVENNSFDESFITDDFSKNQQSQIKEDTIEYVEESNDGDDSLMAKKKKKFVWKWWHYALIGLSVIFIVFMVYIFAVSSNEGPVYGNRCAGLETEINKDLRTAAATTVKEKYSEIKDITLDIECKQLKVDIIYKEKMDTKKAQKIAEEAVKTLDDLVGKTKEEGKTYSTLFGYINNAPQYEVNLFLESTDSSDFPIYGTKHTQNDEFSYTLASVKDETSKEAAQETLKDKK
ncbi:MAG: hypothetical protein RR630_00315 [Coprobacillus sp.]